MKHIGLYLSNLTDRKKLIQLIFENKLGHNLFDTTGLKGTLLSTLTIDKLIDEEFRHDKFTVTTQANASLESMSSGQQRMALANYLLSQKPDFMVLDDIQSSIDATNLQHLLSLFEEHTKTIHFIQLFYRKSDLLPFIKTIYYIDAQGNITETLSSESFQKNQLPEKPGIPVAIPHFFDKMPTFDPLIDLKSVSVSYGTKAVLDRVSWTVRPGEFWQLKGPIGSGKTTLLSMIIGDNPKAYGQDMVLFGIKKGSGESIWDIKKHIGYFYPAMTTRFTHTDTTENMLISGLVDSIGLYMKPTEWQQHIAREWLKLLGPNFQHTYFQNLSPGEQRMLLVARAIIKQPPLLILDEPTAGLDDQNAHLFVELINAIAAEKKMAIVFVSHRTEQGLKADKIFELVPMPNGSKGKIGSN